MTFKATSNVFRGGYSQIGNKNSSHSVNTVYGVWLNKYVVYMCFYFYSKNSIILSLILFR